MDEDDSIVSGDVLIRDGRIANIAEAIDDTVDEVIEANGCAVLPGFVQTHIHLCQTLFRGAADDLALIDWLKKRVWPMEAAHTPESIRASTRLGIAELIKGGTTCAAWPRRRSRALLLRAAIRDQLHARVAERSLRTRQEASGHRSHSCFREQERMRDSRARDRRTKC